MSGGVREDRVLQFLCRHGLHESCYDFDTYVQRFTEEMDGGLSGAPSSLLMLPTFLDVTKNGGMTGDVIAIDAGGTNLRVGLVNFRAGSAPEITYHEKMRVPGAGEPVGKTEFFDHIAACLGPITAHSDKVGFCFSYPTDILPNRDGRIIRFTKEVKVCGGVGALVGTELNDALVRAGKPPCRVTVLNDSTAALLGVVASHRARAQARTYAGYIGLIFGTGANYCYSERISRIGKLRAEDVPAGSTHMLIDAEAGGYAGFARGTCDRILDETSDIPGEQLFEKMASGAYLSALVLLALKLAAEEGLFSAKTAAAITGRDRLEPADIDAVLLDPQGDSALASICEGRQDAERMVRIIGGIYDRAAKLLAIVVAAAGIRCGGGTAEAPILLVADGSTFHKGYRFRERFTERLEQYAACPLHYELVASKDHTLIGAAASVFL